MAEIWGSDEQVIEVSSNSSAEVTYLLLTYPLTINHFLNRTIYPTVCSPEATLISYKVAACQLQRRAAMWRFSSPTASAAIAVVERCAWPSQYGDPHGAHQHRRKTPSGIFSYDSSIR
jgi:hypothetical protein